MNSVIRSWFLFQRFSKCAFKHRESRGFVYRVPIVVPRLIRRDCHTSVEDVKSTDIPNIKDLTKGDETLEKKLKILILELDIWRQEGERVPSCLRDADWKELISLESRNARKKFLLFRWKSEIKNDNAKKRRVLKRAEREEQVNSTERDPDSYGLGGNSLFMRIRDTTMNNFFNGKLIEAMQFSQELVVDCGYDEYMTQRESKNCAKQLMLLFSDNRLHVSPFNLYFCSARRESNTMREFEKYVNTAFEPHFPLNIVEKSYLDLFPKEKLVYLTPHCREELVYDQNAVYILGGIVDKVNTKPLSLARAKEQGLKMARLPLEKFFAWGSGSGKSLTLNQMVMILLDLRLTGDWNKALEHVPARKIAKAYQVDSSANKFKLTESYRDQRGSKYSYNQLLYHKFKKKAIK